MNNLLEAVKDFIEAWEARLPWKLESKYLALRSAVELTEKQKDEKFDNWLFEQDIDNQGKIPLMESAWIESKHVERQRIVGILYEVCKYQENFDLIIEKIYER